jgi:hypothetical protein
VDPDDEVEVRAILSFHGDRSAGYVRRVSDNVTLVTSPPPPSLLPLHLFEPVQLRLWQVRFDSLLTGNNVQLRAPFTWKSDELCNFLNTCRMATPRRECKAPSICNRVTTHRMDFKMVNPGIDYQFYIKLKNVRDCLNWPCKSTQEPCKNIVRVWIVSLVHTLGHTLGFPYGLRHSLIQMGRFLILVWWGFVFLSDW